MITPSYHYVEWKTRDHTAGVPGDLMATELYDLQTDPQENQDVAESEQYRETVKQLARQLQQRWPVAQPLKAC